MQWLKNMVPEYPQFKDLDIKDWEILAEHLSKIKRTICELVLANIVIWKDFDCPKLTMVNQNLCVLINPLNELSYFLEPLGHNKIEETVKICLSHTKRISRASESFVSSLPKNLYHPTCLPGQYDYVYSIPELAQLSGKKFDAKRNHIKKFLSRYPDHGFVNLTAENKDKAIRLFEKWFESKKDSRSFSKMAYVAQKSALDSAFDNFNELKLAGGAILIKEEIKSFYIGSKLNNDTIDLHFHYCDPNTAGLSQFSLQKACSDSFSSYKYINLEQDIGIAGLRKSKLSYHPLKIEKKFEIKRPL
ncbi:MAG: hypothetical protein FD145_1061 [Candidatus Saganbacteria bacterium]|uniref:Phosphatidylglycerol lysyltransferase C-terminal domain-containing protein n=1 Tax=Candidatus Saganbacteria bacterium TaxID=2575572 RepID=A0A833P306_UNCSA|nr:MAG: hypothetical protein FD145_1061 [Candidatus Saganbacteria bacterium]